MKAKICQDSLLLNTLRTMRGLTHYNPLHMHKTYLLFLALSVLIHPASAVAFETLTNDNIRTTTHPAPLSANEDLASATSIPLENGSAMTVERNAFNGIRIWRFQVDDAYWWVTDRGIIWGGSMEGSTRSASTDEEAYAVYLTLPITE